MFVDLAKNIYDIGHVTGEGRQALLDRLLIPDIREDLREDSYLAPCIS